MRRLALAAALLPLMTSGCLLNDWSEDALVEGALRYRIKTLRILGIRVDPPVLAPGVSVTLDALLVSPKGEAEAGTWRTCGLSSDEPAVIQSLNCFESGQDVTELGSGSLPLSYSVPQLDVEVSCGPQGGDTGISVHECAHEVPLMLSSNFADEDARAVSHVSWATEPWPSGQAMPESADSIGRSFYFTDVVKPGQEVEIQYRLRGDVRGGLFRWYVDRGTLGETGLTVAQSWTPPASAGQKGVTTTFNTWTPPDDSSGQELRIYVVWDGGAWAEASALATAPDMVWDLRTVTVQ